MKITKIISIIVSIVLLASVSKCKFQLEVNKYPWFVENNTNHDIKSFLAFGMHSRGHIRIEYPDTVLSSWYGSIDSIGFYKIKMSTKELIYESQNMTYEDDVKGLDADTLSVYIFHADTLQKYTWEQIREDYKILKRYDLGINDIILLKNEYGFPVIPYPPTEAMKNMKMYPPYE
jgi:hypothetical protein